MWKNTVSDSISISHYFISVYLAEEGLQYPSTYKSTLHPEENHIVIILKITSKSYLTFKVNYCTIIRHCSKVTVILQRTVMLKTFIKANTAIIVRTTLLGWLKDLALCLMLHSVPSKQQGRVQKHSAQPHVCSHCTALGSHCLHLEQLFQVLSFMQNHRSFYISPGGKKKFKKIHFNIRML